MGSGRSLATWPFLGLGDQNHRYQEAKSWIYYSSKWSPPLQCSSSSREGVIGHLMVFQWADSSFQKAPTRVRLHLHYHLSPFNLKCVSTYILDFTLWWIFYDVVYWKTVQSSESFYQQPRFPRQFAKHSTAQIKISWSLKATFMSFNRVPARQWVGPIA